MPKTAEEIYKELIEKGNAAQQQANDLLSQIDNRPAFQYDAASDPLYQSYKDQYVHQGKRAMEDTMGQAAGLTGGYGSTYSQSVGNQAYNEYITKASAQIPVLAQQARAAYDAEGQRLLDRYNLARGVADTAYAQGRDALGDIRYNQEYADQLAYQDWQKQQAQQQWDYKVAQESKSQAYEMAMQMISTGQMPNNDLLAQAGISADYARAMAAYYKQQAALSGSSGGGRSSGGSGRRYHIKDEDKDEDKGASGNPLAAMVSGGVNGLSSVLSQTSEPDIPQAELVNWAKKLGNARGDSRVFAQFKQRYGDGKKARAAWKWIGEHYMDYFRGYAKAPNN